MRPGTVNFATDLLGGLHNLGVFLLGIPVSFDPLSLVDWQIFTNSPCNTTTLEPPSVGLGVARSRTGRSPKKPWNRSQSRFRNSWLRYGWMSLRPKKQRRVAGAKKAREEIQHKEFWGPQDPPCVWVKSGQRDIWQFFCAFFSSIWRTLSPDALFTRIRDTRKHPEFATFSCFAW